MAKDMRTISRCLLDGKRLSSIDRETGADNERVLNNLEGCVRSAGSLISDARSVITSRSSATQGSVQRDDLSDRARARVREWIPDPGIHPASRASSKDPRARKSDDNSFAPTSPIPQPSNPPKHTVGQLSGTPHPNTQRGAASAPAKLTCRRKKSNISPCMSTGASVFCASISCT